jgi:hypothetical protein
MQTRAERRLVYQVFDLPRLNGVSIYKCSLIDRKAQLRDLLTNARHGGNLEAEVVGTVEPSTTLSVSNEQPLFRKVREPYGADCAPLADIFQTVGADDCCTLEINEHDGPPMDDPLM